MFKVCAKQCDQCLFGPNRIVSGNRAAQIVKDTTRQDRHFICHKATIKGEDVACRGWYERFSSNLSRIAQRLNAVQFVKLED